MKPTKLLRLQFSVHSPHRPGVTFTQDALFSSREWFARCLAHWSRLGYRYFESPADAAANAGAKPQLYLLTRTSFLDDTKRAYSSELVGVDGSAAGFSYALTAEAAGFWAGAYNLSVASLCVASPGDLHPVS